MKHYRVLVQIDLPCSTWVDVHAKNEAEARPLALEEARNRPDFYEWVHDDGVYYNEPYLGDAEDGPVEEVKNEWKNCRGCGRTISASWKYCPGCGVAL